MSIPIRFADMDIAVNFKAPDAQLEGRLYEKSADRAAVITHPHPLYGGDMDNPVVMVIAKAYQQSGWSTLRFNFRGTGHSQGRYVEGSSETADVQAAIDTLQARGFTRIDLAGYSFGAWALARWSQNRRDHTHRLILVAPPVAFMDFQGLGSITGLACVIAAGRDDLAPPGRIETLLPSWRPEAELKVIPEADHFFWEHFKALHQALTPAICRD